LFILAYFLSSSSYFPFSLLSITYFSFPSTPITYIYSLSLHDALPIWRFVFLELIRKWARPIHHSISHEREELNIYYTTTIEVSEEAEEEKIVDAYLAKFQEVEKREIERGTTLLGPHRDDLVFLVNGKDVQTFGSQGQQRTTALSLKLAEIDLIHNKVGEYPILLLDDVLSELDESRQSHLLNTIQGKVQTFVSTTSVDGIDHETLRAAELFRVHNGK